MEAPIAYFGYSKVGNTVHFQNLSLNAPTSFRWEFGDTLASTDINPTHEYATEGFFEVTLIASREDSGVTIDSEPLTITVGISEVDDVLNTSIIKLIDHYLPMAFRLEASVNEKISMVQKWQLYLQPLVVIPYKVQKQDIYNELKWPGLVNLLIGQLAAKDIMLMVINRFLVNIGLSSVEEAVGPNSMEKELKSIETGPAKTEFYQENIPENYKNLSQAYLSITTANGPYTIVARGLCELAQRLRIYLPTCGPLNYSPTVPRVFKRLHHHGHNANPFGVTKRML